MAEYRFWEEDVPEVSTQEWHFCRERAPHWEQADHNPRLRKAREYVYEALRALSHDGIIGTVSDMGCGDGGLLASLKAAKIHNTAWGYDFTPSNVMGGAERGVRVLHKNFITGDDIEFGSVTVATEVLEHMADPHSWVAKASYKTKYIVASSPNDEKPDGHLTYHVWGWDMEGYEKLLVDGGFEIVKHELADWSQVILAKSTR